jgi:hypothetical protein
LGEGPLQGGPFHKLLAEIKAQFNAHSGPPRGWVMLKTISKAGFDVVAVLTMIVTVFYLAAITHIMPLPENALSRINEVSLAVMDVLLACCAWLNSLLLALFSFF